ncbi:phage antirepressor N-terminal domain-containing protein, partial [Salmonella enterica]|uniref:phage antirepressor N-terminal domain-containing protein n=1 Tax=Salmonella enterica TaxID=28901 RepID=UPI003D76859C
MNALVQVPFHGDVIWASRPNGHVEVAIKPICDSLGLDWSSQLKRIKRDAILSE